MVAIQKVGGSALTIPTPTEPSMPDEDPSAYVPTGMSAADRQQLREAGIEWTGTLGGFMTRQGGRVNDRRQAALNMNHFRTGNGADRRLSAGFVDDMDDESVQLSTFQNGRLETFLEMIRDDLAGAATGQVARYLLKNDEGGVNDGTNWYGIYSDAGTGLYFTVGGFFVSYGAFAARAAASVNITYKMFIWDRYNWDSGKETTIPGNQLSWLLDDGEMNDIAGMLAPAPAGVPATDYFQRREDSDGNISYVVNDSLMGALIESGDADNFDIVGSGNVQTRRFTVARNGPTPAPSTGPHPASPQSQPPPRTN